MISTDPPAPDTGQWPEKAYYTPLGLAARWDCSKDIVYDLLRQGKLHGFKLGREWRITDEDRLAYEQDPENSRATEYRHLKPLNR